MKQAITPTDLPEVLGPYSPAVIAGDFLFISGQLGVDKSKHQGGTVEEQAESALKNLAVILAEAGLSMAEVVKTTVLLTDINDFATVNEVYAGKFPNPKPARAAYAVAGLPGGAKVEIEAIALLHR